mgnify:CR=1 FL=1
MKRTPMATALRTCCAERTRAMQLVCMCAYAQVCADTCTVLFTERLCLERHEVQVRQEQEWNKKYSAVMERTEWRISQ